MTITFMWDSNTGTYTLIILNNNLRATVDTQYITQVANMVHILHSAYEIRLVFHSSVLSATREELKQLLNSKNI